MDFFVWLEQARIAVWVNAGESLLAYPTVLMFHTIGLTLVVGINIAIDLRLLGFAPQIPIATLQRFFTLMWIGLAINATSGVLLFMAKATKMAVNPAFYVKMTAIVFALGVFFAIKAKVFARAASDQAAVDANGRMLAALSLVLWLTAITAGRVMAYVGEAAEFGLFILK